MTEAVIPGIKQRGFGGAVIDREPFAWLRERDIDLLVCAELQVDGPLRNLFGRVVGAESAAFKGAWVSHAEIDGESDLVLAWHRDSGSIVVLVENKVAAEFQPDQAARYRARAERWAARSDVTRALTLLLAPSDYMARDGANEFDVQLTYEAVCEALRTSDDPRSGFLGLAIEAGIASYRRGYVPELNEAVSDIWTACWDVASRLTPQLRMGRPGGKPSGSTWIYFREADGLRDQRRAVVVYKAERGQVDLQFSGLSPAELELRCEGLLDPAMEVVPAKKSSSIRIQVPRLDFSAPPETQIPVIEPGLLAAERLRTLAVRHRETLLVV